MSTQDSQSPPLWTLIQELIGAHRLRGVTELVRLSGVSRPAIYTIKRGRTPTPETLRLLANGFAADPRHPDRVNRDQADEIYRTLFAAAGYPTSSVAPPPGELAERLRAAFGEDAAAIEDFLRRAPELDEADRSLVLETVAWLRARVEAGRIHARSRASG